jgi:hypothetical protein
MKRTSLIIMVPAFVFAGCSQSNTTGSQVAKIHKFKLSASPVSPASYSRFIPVDSANKMISSYLNSINYQSNDTDLRSLIFNADSLITYITSAKLANVKLMFAHTLDYINNGGKDQYAGYQSGALTLVIAGYDSSGNYVYYNYPSAQMSRVLENSMPCPTACPATGTASSDLLPK